APARAETIPSSGHRRSHYRGVPSRGAACGRVVWVRPGPGRDREKSGRSQGSWTRKEKATEFGRNGKQEHSRCRERPRGSKTLRRLGGTPADSLPPGENRARTARFRQSDEGFTNWPSLNREKRRNGDKEKRSNLSPLIDSPVPRFSDFCLGKRTAK